MKVKITTHPGEKPYAVIELIPETNEDMVGMEWALACELEPEARQVIRRTNSDVYGYAILLKRRVEE